MRAPLIICTGSGIMGTIAHCLLCMPFTTHLTPHISLLRLDAPGRTCTQDQAGDLDQSSTRSSGTGGSA